MRSGYLFAWLGTLTLLAMTCQAQPRRSGIRNHERSSRDTLTRILEMSKVRKEIELRPFQIEMLEDLQADLAEQRRAAYTNDSAQEPPRSREEFDQATRDRFDAVRTAVQQVRAQGEQLITVILDSDQKKRLFELRLQEEGTRALDRQAFREQLKVTDEQFEKIRELRRTEDDPSLPRVRRQKKLDEIVLGLLSQEQQAKFKELQGETFEFPLADLRSLGGPQEGSRQRRPSN